MRKISATFVLVVLLFGMFATRFNAQEVGPITLEPVSGLFFPELAELNEALKAAGFATLVPPIRFAGSWSHSRIGDWPVGASIVQGGIAAGGGARFAQLGMQLVSLFSEARFRLSEAVPQLQGTLSAGLAYGQVNLFLTQRPVDEGDFQEVLKNPHDTLLGRLFLAALPRAGVEFKLGRTLALRGSLGFVLGLWDSGWTHAVERVLGPPPHWGGLLIEFTIAYVPPAATTPQP
jgi:hypothetical protein